MGYDSVDKLQNLLASEVFHYTNDRKKAAGRALGTFVELITYYVIKNWNLEYFTAIEHSLPEFANNEITHNVEFTLHGNRLIVNGSFDEKDFPLSCKTIIKKHFDGDNIIPKNGMIVDRNKVIKNAFVLTTKEKSFISIFVNSSNNSYRIYELKNKPFAMFECKRVGVEEGMYNEHKMGNVITKVKIDYYADIALTTYFKQNEEKINAWFNIITPKDKNLKELQNELVLLSNKNWYAPAGERYLK